MRLIPYALVGLPEASSERIAAELEGLGRMVSKSAMLNREGVAHVLGSEAQVILLDGSADPEEAIVLAHSLSELGRKVVLLHDEPGPELLLAALRAGCQDVVPQGELGALKALFSRVVDEAAAHPPKGQLIAVMGGHGGIGTTTVALALADLLAKEPDHQVVVVDMDEADRSMRAALDLPGGLTAQALARVAEQWDASKIRDSLTCTDDGFYVLGQEEDVLAQPALGAEQVPVVLAALRRAFTHLVVDLGGSFNAVAQEVVIDAQHLVLVSAQQLLSLRTTHTRLSQLDALGVGKNQIWLVLNRFDPHHGPSRQTVEEQLGHPVVGRLPEDPAAEAAQQDGKPLPEEAPRSRLARTLQELAATMEGRTLKRTWAWPFRRSA